MLAAIADRLRQEHFTIRIHGIKIEGWEALSIRFPTPHVNVELSTVRIQNGFLIISTHNNKEQHRFELADPHSLDYFNITIGLMISAAEQLLEEINNVDNNATE